MYPLLLSILSRDGELSTQLPSVPRLSLIPSAGHLLSEGHILLTYSVVILKGRFVFFFVWFLLSFTGFLHKPTILAAAAAGAALGLATLVRPTTQFMILLAPVLLPLILMISKMMIDHHRDGKF